jgi:predicted outer membrane repeat protein
VGCTLSGNSATTAGGGLYMHESFAFRVETTIIANSPDGGAVGCTLATSPFFSCTDIFNNTGGDWIGCIAGQGGSSSNFSADPLFCDVTNDNYGLDSKSPCAPGGMPGTCGLIGALPVACGVIDVADSAAPAAPAGAKVTPNPIASTGLLEWHNPEAGSTNLYLYDATGRLVASRELGHRVQGRQHASWGQVVGGESVPAGVYFLRVKAPASEDQVVRVVVAR